MEADQGRYLAMTVSSVPELRLTEARLTADQWEEVGKEIRQPHSKLRSGVGHSLKFTIFGECPFCVLLT